MDEKTHFFDLSVGSLCLNSSGLFLTCAICQQLMDDLFHALRPINTSDVSDQICLGAASGCPGSAVCLSSESNDLGFPSLTLTSLVGVTQQRLLLRSEPRRGSVLHPGGDGELVREILRYHPVGDLSRLMTVEPEDQIAVPPAVRHQGSRPVGGGAGGRQESRSHGHILSRCGCSAAPLSSSPTKAARHTSPGAFWETAAYFLFLAHIRTAWNHCMNVIGPTLPARFADGLDVDVDRHAVQRSLLPAVPRRHLDLKLLLPVETQLLLADLAVLRGAVLVRGLHLQDAVVNLSLRHRSSVLGLTKTPGQTHSHRSPESRSPPGPGPSAGPLRTSRSEPPPRTGPPVLGY
ncbi:hypothetical protein F7725_021126 [Dissostichus mawsoni]|uniref:Uncharacterized protein n=1 Tax=Dissostichus mawsoni TaxID=36200 RepID=A0A7J5YII1_DISMA|nr:hypothetical protein F7725_021126 [Dissostichus mawsoni]